MDVFRSCRGAIYCARLCRLRRNKEFNEWVDEAKVASFVEFTPHKLSPYGGICFFRIV